MEKRYHVFISSTYTDLKEERWQALKALMTIDCIVSGMEMFPALDQDQFEYIKEIINSCDYYLLIIGGRYGSLASDGKSYTEKEYEYAVSKGIKVIALIHESPESLDESKKETDGILINKLDLFINKVKLGRLVDFWKTTSDIQGKVLIGITHAIKHFPATGWVRADKIANESALIDINNLQKEKEALRNEIAKLKTENNPEVQNIAALDDLFDIRYQCYIPKRGSRAGYYTDDTCSVTWKAIFYEISPVLMKAMHVDALKREVEKRISAYTHHAGLSLKIDPSNFDTILIQLKMLNLIMYKELNLKDGGTGMFCRLTPFGEKTMIEIRTVQKMQEELEQ